MTSRGQSSWVVLGRPGGMWRLGSLPVLATPLLWGPPSWLASSLCLGETTNHCKLWILGILWEPLKPRILHSRMLSKYITGVLGARKVSSPNPAWKRQGKLQGGRLERGLKDALRSSGSKVEEGCSGKGWVSFNDLGGGFAVWAFLDRSILKHLKSYG